MAEHRHENDQLEDLLSSTWRNANDKIAALEKENEELKTELAEFREQHNFEWVETNTKLAWFRNTIAELRTERKWLRSELAAK